MKSIVLVGPHSVFGRAIAKHLAKQGVKIAVVSWIEHCDVSVPKECSQAEVVKTLNSTGAKAVGFTGDLTKKHTWDKLYSEITSFLGDRIDLLLYMDGVFIETEFAKTENVAKDPKYVMDINFMAPMFCINALLSSLQKASGLIAPFIAPSAGRGPPNTTIYSASRRALTSYLHSISLRFPQIQVCKIYPGSVDCYQIVNWKPIFENRVVLDEQSVMSIVNAIGERNDEVSLSVRKSKYCENPYLVPDPPMFCLDGANNLCVAICKENTVEVKEILKTFKTNPDMLVEKDKFGRNAFHYVAKTGCIQTFDSLVGKLRKKNILSTPDNFKWTPLHFAARFGNLRMVKRIIREGGDPNALTNLGVSALHFLSRFEPPNDLKMISAFLQTLKVILDYGADTNQRNYDWYTPIHEAAYCGSVTALSVLLKNEGDPHRKTKQHHRTPLCYATKMGHKKAMEILLEAGADPVECFDFATEDLQPLLEKYREKNCRPESDEGNHKREVIIIRGMEDFPPSATKIINTSGLLNKMELVNKNWDTFLYVMRFLTRKIYRTPEEFAENPAPEPKRIVASRTKHGLTLEQATEKLISPGNPRKLFKILEDVGRGGFGSVVQVKRVEDKREVAIKKVPHLTEKEQWNNMDEIYFLQECRHACVVKYSTSYLSRDEMWMVMEFMEGGSLQQAVSKYRLEEKQICYVTREILKGLRFIHSKGFAHRDLKSANIMLTINGDIKIIDFGLCVEIGSVETKNMVGSPFWLPPEMITRKEHGTPADIWSLAILCLEMAHGKPPHRSSALKSMFYVGAGITPSLETPSDYSDEFKDFLDKMFKIDPNERLSAAELLKHPWIETADTRKGMVDILRHIFVEKSLEKSLGI